MLRRPCALLDAERTRRVVGSVHVPFGTCSEPSNVAAGGGACPLRFRCVGCDHFSTDVYCLPELRAYLDGLLRQGEKLRSMTEGDDWARAEATPSEGDRPRPAPGPSHHRGRTSHISSGVTPDTSSRGIRQTAVGVPDEALRVTRNLGIIIDTRR